LKFSQDKGWEAFSDLLEAIPTPPRVVIYERFIIDDDIKKHVGEEHVTIQNIGILKAYARRNGAELVGQTNKILKLGYGWGQITPATQKKDSHRRDALAHGVFYLVKNNIREVRRM
jgi:hypothetical protein